jgi:hypothetical protein
MLQRPVTNKGVHTGGNARGPHPVVKGRDALRPPQSKIRRAITTTPKDGADLIDVAHRLRCDLHHMNAPRLVLCDRRATVITKRAEIKPPTISAPQSSFIRKPQARAKIETTRNTVQQFTAQASGRICHGGELVEMPRFRVPRSNHNRTDPLTIQRRPEPLPQRQDGSAHVRARPIGDLAGVALSHQPRVDRIGREVVGYRITAQPTAKPSNRVTHLVRILPGNLPAQLILIDQV